MRPEADRPPAFPPISPAILATWESQGRFGEFAGRPVFAAVHDTHGPARPWLLLVHGFPTASLDWFPLWSHLAKDFNLLAPDLLGFGFSDKPKAHDYTMAEQADLIAHWCDTLGIAQVHVVAHNYGVTVAQELLARDRERAALGQNKRLASIVFLNGGLFPETHRSRLIQKLLLTPIGPWLSRLMTKRTFARSFAALFGPATQPRAAEIDAFWQLISRQQGQHIAHRLVRYIPERRRRRERWVGALATATIPMRLVNGARDPVSGEHMAARFRDLVHEADVVWLDDIGHYPQIEAPDRVYASLGNFWRRIGAIATEPTTERTLASLDSGARRD